MRLDAADPDGRAIGSHEIDGQAARDFVTQAF
jgi:hypothetical protein